MKKFAVLLTFTGFFLAGNAQGIFSGPIVLDNGDSYAKSIITADIDGDGDSDVLSVFSAAYKIAWYENDGNGIFGDQNIITTNVKWPASVYAVDLDSDGDLDVVTGSKYKVAWCENDGNGVFGNLIPISSNVNMVRSVYAADLDGDGDSDVISASSFDYKIAWYENDGNGNFGDQIILSSDVSYAWSVYAADLDNDVDLDILVIAANYTKILWFENFGDGNFGAENVIYTDTSDVGYSITASDLDGDGDLEVLAGSAISIIWFENFGNGNFGNKNVIINDTSSMSSVYARDLDNDGDQDVLSASTWNDKIRWFENDGNGHFDNQHIIYVNDDNTSGVFASDLDGDHDFDVLSTPAGDFKIGWYKNKTYTFSQPSPRECCLNSSTEFVIEDALNVLSYQWQKLNGNLFENISDGGHYSGATTQSLTINSVTSDMDNNHYRCLLTIGNNQVASKDAVLTVLPLPETEDITGNPNPAPFDTCTYAVANPGNSSFDWTVEGGSIIGGTENSKDILWGEAGYGNLSVIETDTNGCQGIPVQLTIIIDVDELLAKYNIRVFPNPTTGKVRIEGDKIQKIEILTAGGKPMRSTVSKGEDIEIDLSGERPGLYFITFILKDKTIVRKLILE